jgi:asparagine synthetase B (glutamine-hydrolysing)
MSNAIAHRGPDDSGVRVEATHAAAIARRLSTEHTELYVTPEDSLDLIPPLPEFKQSEKWRHAARDARRVG